MPNDPVIDIAEALARDKVWNAAAIAIARHGALAGVSAKEIVVVLTELAFRWRPHWPDDPNDIAEIVQTALDAVPQVTKKGPHTMSVV